MLLRGFFSPHPELSYYRRYWGLVVVVEPVVLTVVLSFPCLCLVFVLVVLLVVVPPVDVSCATRLGTTIRANPRLKTESRFIVISLVNAYAKARVHVLDASPHS